MKTSESQAAILPALLQVQGEVGNVQRNAQNPHFRSSYVTLDAILHALRPPSPLRVWSSSRTPRWTASSA